jgi:L-malate glycosyltransferase
VKILQIIQKPQLRGAEIFACQLSELLIKGGAHVDVLYLFDNALEMPFDLTFIRLGARKEKRFWDFRAYKKIADIITEGQYDLVQANAGDTLKYAVISRLLHRWKAPLIFRNANNMSSFIRSRMHRLLNGVWIRNVQYIISVSDNCRLDLLNLFPSAKSKIETIPIGTFSFEHVTPIASDSPFPVIIGIGGFVKEKNFGFLIRVFARLKSTFPSASLWLVGDGPLKQTLTEAVRENNLAESVVFWGVRKDVIRLLKRSSALVVPSTIEGLPGVILEALSCKVPVVAANVGGIGEVIVQDKTGFCLDDWDEEQYVNCLTTLFTNKKLCSSYTEAGQRLIEEKYLMHQITSRFLEAYKKLIKT